MCSRRARPFGRAYGAHMSDQTRARSYDGAANLILGHCRTFRTAFRNYEPRISRRPHEHWRRWVRNIRVPVNAHSMAGIINAATRLSSSWEEA